MGHQSTKVSVACFEMSGSASFYLRHYPEPLATIGQCYLCNGVSMAGRTDYSAFKALDPFFAIIKKGLDGLVDGDHLWDFVANDAVFEFLYDFPGWPRKLESRAAIMEVFSGYGRNISLNSSDGLVVHRGLDSRIVVLEYEVHGTVLSTRHAYDNRFASIITVENRKVVHWRDYMDSLAAMRAIAPPDTTLGSLGRM
ncbi:MAG: limonene,2-epoxide hydrolase [Rhodospirillales bacterium]|nr:limonene,2-epoxide hydrolase [Rhodospirillales bacterium]